MIGLTKPQQSAARKTIAGRGQTVPGWARANRLNVNSVINVLYRDYGRAKELTPTAEEIVGRLIEQGLVGGRS